MQATNTETFDQGICVGTDVRDAIGLAMSIFGGPEPRESYRILSEAAQHATECAPLPRILQVEATRRCNLRCTMCPRTRSLAQAAQGPDYDDMVSYWQLDLDRSLFATVLGQCGDAEAVMLHGIGEPLLHPQILDLVETATKRRLECSFFSNGTLLSRFARPLVAAGLSRITLSIDGASAGVFERIRRGAKLECVVEGIRSLVRSKQELEAAKPDVACHVTLCNANRGDVSAILDMAASLEACEVSISPIEPADTLIQAYRETPNLLEQDLGSWRRIASALGLALITTGMAQGCSRQASAGSTRGFCIWPWIGLYVTVDGKILPCCHLTDTRRYALGDTKSESVAEIWNGERFRLLRQGLLTQNPQAAHCLECAYYIH